MFRYDVSLMLLICGIGYISCLVYYWNGLRLWLLLVDLIFMCVFLLVFGNRYNYIVLNINLFVLYLFV